MKLLYTLFMLMLISQITFAQTNGQVLDRNNRGIEGAFVLQNSKGSHYHTDRNGNFTIEELAIGDTLRVNALGYETITREIKNFESDLTFTLAQRFISLNEVVIAPEMDALHIFADVNLQTNPVNNSQELLRTVPGLVIGQHAGGGKAEQIFLRGFDIDHGTDISLSVNGMPVNMVSHAHGQGYADMHWVTPETIECINFGKGPYFAERGDFTTAGFVDFKLKDRLQDNLIRFELGQFDTQRILGMYNLLDQKDHSAWISTEYISTDGAFESPQNFKRINLMGRYAGQLENNDRIGFTATYFKSSWDASGQIPQRAVDQGIISRFGAIDDTEGGSTSRMNLQMDYTKNIDENSFVKTMAYYSEYDFELYSNFTFFLEDSVNGDQIKQKEARQLFGGNAEYNRYFDLGGNKVLLQLGGGLRNDQTIDSELSHTVNRITTLDTLKLGDINQTNSYAYANIDFTFGKWKVNPGLRFDYFEFDYYDKLLPEYLTQTQTKSIVSPKLNFQYNYSSNLQLYLNTGKGFHSNDTRVVVAQKGIDILPAAYGADLGAIWKPAPKLLVNAALWTLYLEQEFVYVGDAGVVEPGGKTQRQGVDLSLRYQPLAWLYADLDVNYTFARSVDDPEGANYIPLAPEFTAAGGLSAMFENGLYAAARVRHIADRPANEDNSIVAIGYTVVDFNMGYQWKSIELGLKIQNLFDVEWNETQFATETRLADEPAPVEEITFTPGTPFMATAVITYRF